MILRTISLVLLSSSIIACSNPGTDHDNTDQQSDSTNVVADSTETGMYGMEIDAEGALSPSEFIAAMEGKDSLAVKLKGNIKACCVKKGCWMDLDLEDGTTLKVKFKDYGFFVPLDSKGKETIVQGTAYLKETPVDELKHYAEDGGKSQEEIDAITKPELAYTFIADGVIIE